MKHVEGFGETWKWGLDHSKKRKKLTMLGTSHS